MSTLRSKQPCWWCRHHPGWNGSPELQRGPGGCGGDGGRSGEWCWWRDSQTTCQRLRNTEDRRVKAVVLRLSVGQEVLPGRSPSRASIQMGRRKVTVVPQCRVSSLKSGPVVWHGGPGCYLECESPKVPTGSASRSSSCCISWLPVFLKLTHLDGREARGRRAESPQQPSSLYPSPALLSSLCGSIHAGVRREVPTFCRITGCLNMQMPRASLGCVRRLGN